ncbi:MAG: hypothetical protein A3F88_08815 [Deltaproteobacteria bacterium RIFCSPLOWO2_12_FULL_42_16]|nr:MAG: hypothetical protein A3F88_08815 [Deltaproteobacteria bacterium RIFCSPLOWO2_12_FULL_42_16]
MFCFRHPKRIAVKVCYHCGRLVCPKCQWRDSHHTFCGQACYKRYIFWQKVKEIRRMVIREVRAFSLLLSKKAAAIPIGNGYVPAILPILALTSIHTYTTLTTKDYKPSIRYEIQEFKDSSPEIRSLDTTIKNLKTTDTAQIVVAYNAQPEENNLKNLFEKKIKLQPKTPVIVKPKFIAPDITRGNVMKNELSITFDGGSEATDTEAILNILRERNIKTTIFLTGEFIKRYPELVKKMVEDGHEIGNHSLTHPHLTTFEKNFKQQTLHGVNKEFITRQLKETARIFKELTGKDMIPYWRATYGEQNAEIRQWAYETGFTHIGWTTDYKNRESLDSLDWVSNEESEFYYSADEIKDRILNFDKGGNEVKGGIVLMHLGTDRKDSHVSTKLPEIIDSLEQRGYRFVKVSELLNKRR